MRRPKAGPPAYLLIVPGTGKKEKRQAFTGVVEEFRRAFPGRRVEPVFLDFSRPSMAKGIEACVKSGAREIVVLPLPVPMNRNAFQDIPFEIQAGKRRFPEVDFHFRLLREKIARTEKSRI